MPRSKSGFREGYLITKGALAAFAAGQNLPAGSYARPIGIAGPPSHKFEDYDPPKDAFGNILRNKKLHSYSAESFQVDFTTFEVLKLFAVNGGCDFILVNEGIEEYQGDANGNEGQGVIWWRKNPSEGIFFYEYANRAHMGIDLTFKLTPKSASLMVDLKAAVGFYKHTQLVNSAWQNIIRRDTIALPDYHSERQFVLSFKNIQYNNGASWIDIFNWEDIATREFTAKTVPNLNDNDSRSQPNYVEYDLQIVSNDATIGKLWAVQGLDQFYGIRLLEEDVLGNQYIIEFKKNTLTNILNKDAAQQYSHSVFRLNGQCSIHRWEVKDTTKSMTIG